MFKKILAIIISFLLVFNITVVNYKALPCYAIDGGIVVGGAIIGGEELAKIVMGVLASVGGAYIINEKKEDIKHFSGDVANSYIQYLDDEKNASVYTSQQFSKWLDKSYDAIRYGTSKAITISTDMYNSFKTFINEVLTPLPSGDGAQVVDHPTISIVSGFSDYFVNDVAPNVYFTYKPLEYPCISSDAYYVNGSKLPNLQYYRANRSSWGWSYPYSLNSITFNGTSSDGLIDSYTANISIYRESSGSTASKDNIGFSAPHGQAIKIYLNDVIFMPETIPNTSDIPDWRKPIENNDIKIKSINGENLIDNYDVIDFNNSYVDSKTGNLVGDRTITIPTDLGSLDRIWDKYINGELTDEQLVTGVNDVIGVKGVDTSIDGVTDTTTGVSLPLDTPIWGTTVGDTTGETVGDIVNESDKVNDSSVSGFPDLTEIFPFCIPFDILRLLKLLRTPMEVPVFEIPIDIPWFNVHYDMVLDMAQFSSLATIVRTFMALMWVVFLILATRRLIRA